MQICDKTTSVIIWKNLRPSSSRFYRPIKIEFLHETAEAAKVEIDKIEAQITNLMPFQIVMGGKIIITNSQLLLTIIDGKIYNFVTNTSSSMRC